MSRTSAFLVLLLAACAFGPQLACGDHDRLAKTNASSSTGGMGGDAPSSSSAGGMGGSGGIVEPPGPTKLTFINGIADADAARFCFLEYPDPAAGVLPWPDVSGLAFAQSAVIDLDDELVPAGSDVEVLAIGGQLGASGGMTCEALRASPPNGVIVRSIAVVPASVFEEEKSLLLVPNGCLGGPFKTDEEEERICGFGYDMNTGNAAMAAGFMSRIGNSDRVAMQFVQASAGMEPVALSVKPGTSGATAQQVVDTWSAGAIQPFPPFMGFGLAQLGQVADSRIVLVGKMGSPIAYEASFGDALAESDLDSGDIINGENIVFVGVGAAPGLAGSWWQPFTLTVVRADP